MQEILDGVEKYITDLHRNKTWEAGKDWVQYAGPYYDHREYVAAVRTLLGEWLVLGSEGIKFERKFCKLLGKKMGVFTNSGSSANLLMMSAVASKNGLNLKGANVIVPIAGFPTTFNPILQCGMKPVFVDIELETLNIDVNQLKEKNGEILTFAHVLGNPPNMDDVMKIVDDKVMVFLEDTCDALNSTYDGKLLGSYGYMSSCSLYPAHHLTCGEGGFVAMNDLDTERVVRSFREWGRGCYCQGKANLLADGTCGCRFNNWLPSLPDEIFDHKYVYTDIGYNLKPIEAQAAMGLVQIEKLPEITRLRKENYKMLYKVFSKYDSFIIHRETAKADPNWFAFPLTLKDGCGFKRNEICQFFESKKIQTRQYFAGAYILQPAYEGMFKERIEDFPVARKVTTDTFFLGVAPVITKEKIDYIEEILHEFMRGK